MMNFIIRLPCNYDFSEPNLPLPAAQDQEDQNAISEGKLGIFNNNFALI